MTYVAGNPKTKKEVKDMVKNGMSADKLFEPGLGSVPENGVAYLEGPHYPEPHKWYATAKIENGMVVKVS